MIATLDTCLVFLVIGTNNHLLPIIIRRYQVCYVYLCYECAS